MLSSAAARGDAAFVKILLDSGTVEPDSRDLEDRTPLSHAADGGYETVVETLLDNGRVDPDSRNAKGRTPLSYAAGRGHKMVVKTRIDSGRVEIDSRDCIGRTPLSYAASRGDRTVVKMLLNSDQVDPDSKDATGRTPLSWVAGTKRLTTNLPRMLLETSSVNPSSQDEKGLTPLWWTIQLNWEELVILLLGTDQLDINLREKSTGRTLLSHAARIGNVVIVKALLGRSNVDLNSKDDRGVTPLTWAADYGNRAVTRLLLNSEKLEESLQENIGLEIDARYLRHWIQSCDSQHAGRCKPRAIPQRLPHQIPDWVIDITDGCLVPGHTASRYIALSYVWSIADSDSFVQATERLLLKRTNLNDFQEPFVYHFNDGTSGDGLCIPIQSPNGDDQGVEGMCHGSAIGEINTGAYWTCTLPDQDINASA
jgi:ankyrin repeat protein